MGTRKIQQRYDKEERIILGHRKVGRNGRKITEDTPLNPVEQRFLQEYLKTGNIGEAMQRADKIERCSRNAYHKMGAKILDQPNVKKELDRIMEEVRKDTIATADEVMQYFTNVMRGEVKDQFGLDAPLTERTRAAQEIAKRTIDIDIKERLMQEVDDKPIQITLNWARNDNS